MEKQASTNCPYCGRPMERGILSGDGRSAVYWKAGNDRARLFDRLNGIGRVTNIKTPAFGVFFTVPADYCARCKKIIFDADISK